jgi:hypothetical protein
MEGQAQGTRGHGGTHGGLTVGYITPDQFVFWLRGYIEASPGVDQDRHLLLIREHLGLVALTQPSPQRPPCGCGR